MAVQRCYLLALPPELRNHIYDFLFSDHNCYRSHFILDISATGVFCHKTPGTRDIHHNRTAIIRTCRFISTEASSALLACTAFQVNICNWQLEQLESQGWRGPQSSSASWTSHGTLKDCVLLTKISRVQIKIMVSAWYPDSSSMSHVVELLKQVFARLGSATPFDALKVSGITIDIAKLFRESMISSYDFGKMLKALKLVRTRESVPIVVYAEYGCIQEMEVAIGKMEDRMHISYFCSS